MRALVAGFVVALAVVASGAAAAPPTKVPGELRVGLSMPAAGFQVGAVRGRDVVRAKGLEIDLARLLARRLGITRVRFVNERFLSTLVRAGKKDWDIALAQITVTPVRAKRVDFSTAYLTADQGVLLRRGLATRPTSIAALRRLQLCAERASTSGQLIVNRIKPTRKPRLVANPSNLLYDLFAQRCDAIVFDAPALAVLQRQAPDRYGPLVGRIVTRERYALALEKGSPLRPQINAALASVIESGALKQLRRRWLGTDTSTLRVLR